MQPERSLSHRPGLGHGGKLKLWNGMGLRVLPESMPKRAPWHCMALAHTQRKPVSKAVPLHTSTRHHHPPCDVQREVTHRISSYLSHSQAAGSPSPKNAAAVCKRAGSQPEDATCGAGGRTHRGTMALLTALTVRRVPKELWEAEASPLLTSRRELDPECRATLLLGLFGRGEAYWMRDDSYTAVVEMGRCPPRPPRCRLFT